MDIRDTNTANQSLKLVLAQLQGRRIVALLNRGNRGDGVIHMGGRRLFQSLGLTWHEVHEDDRNLAGEGGDVLLVFGCGGFGRGYNSLVKATLQLAKRFDEIIILPASFDVSSPRVSEFAESWDKRFTIVCREMVSFDALSKQRIRPGRLLLGHDLAFHADLSEWTRRPAKGEIGIFRRDNEATPDHLPPDLEYQDASHGSERDPEPLLDFVARHAVIHTDRCHAAITGAMMGRRVHLYRNNYFKNRAIFEHSLAQFPHVEFMEAGSFSLARVSRTFYWRRLRPIEMRTRRVFQFKTT